MMNIASLIADKLNRPVQNFSQDQCKIFQKYGEEKVELNNYGDNRLSINFKHETLDEGVSTIDEGIANFYVNTMLGICLRCPKILSCLTGGDLGAICSPSGSWRFYPKIVVRAENLPIVEPVLEV